MYPIARVATTKGICEARASSLQTLLWKICYENTAVGFIMVRYLYPNNALKHQYPAETCYELSRIMIDAKYQGSGYGMAALQQILRYIRTKPLGPASRLYLSFHPQNTVAQHLYHSAGFEETTDYNALGEKIAFISI